MYSLGGSAEIRIYCIHTLSLLKVEQLNKLFDFMSANVNSQVFRKFIIPQFCTDLLYVHTLSLYRTECLLYCKPLIFKDSKYTSYIGNLY